MKHPTFFKGYAFYVYIDSTKKFQFYYKNNEIL